MNQGIGTSIPESWKISGEGGEGGIRCFLSRRGPLNEGERGAEIFNEWFDTMGTCFREFSSKASMGL